MVKRITAVIRRDIMSSLRDAMMLWILLAPIAIAFLLKIFIPAANTASLQYAVLSGDGRLSAHLGEYGSVETFESLDQLNARVEKSDDITGVVEENGKFRIIMEGNETEGILETTENILMAYTGLGEAAPVKISVSDLGWKVSMTALVGGASLMMLAFMLGGMLSGLNIVEERQSKTIKAIKASPLTMTEFVIAKSVMGIVIPFVQSLLILAIVGLTDINWGMAAVITLASSLIGLIIGILIGVINEDPITAAASIKMVFLPITASILGALLLPQNWMFVLWWSPFYWTYRGVSEIILKTATWGGILLYSGIILGITGIVFAALRGKIRRGLAE